MESMESLDKYDSVELLIPSKYVKCADLRGKHVTVTIEGIDPRQELARKGGAKEKKPVVYFKGAEKGLVLNVTNTHAIAEVYGPKPSGWIGKKITLKPDKDRFGPKIVDCIRIDIPATKRLAAGNGKAKAAATNGAAAKTQAPPPPPPPEPPAEPENDADDSGTADGPLFGSVEEEGATPTSESDDAPAADDLDGLTI